MSGRTLGNGSIRRINEGVAIGAGNANVVTIWQFATNDLATAVEAAGFFNSLADSMAVGDIIFASLDLDGTPQLKNYMVTAISAAKVVTVALQTTT